MERVSTICGCNDLFKTPDVSEKKGQRGQTSILKSSKTLVTKERPVQEEGELERELDSPVRKEGKLNKPDPGISLFGKKAPTERFLVGKEAQARARIQSLVSSAKSEALQNQLYQSPGINPFAVGDSSGNELDITPSWQQEYGTAEVWVPKEVDCSLAKKAWQASQPFKYQLLPVFKHIRQRKANLQYLLAFANKVDVIDSSQCRVELLSSKNGDGEDPLAQRFINVISARVETPKLVTVYDNQHAPVDCHLVLCEGTSELSPYWTAFGSHDETRLTNKFVVDAPLEASNACLEKFSAYDNHKIVIHDLAPESIVDYTNALRTVAGNGLLF